MLLYHQQIAHNHTVVWDKHYAKHAIVATLETKPKLSALLVQQL